MRKAFDQLNVVFVTIDCCRYDTAIEASTPFLDSVGPIRRALTFATYTLPSHISMFAGYLPRTMDEPILDFYSREAKQLWRLTTARHRDPDKIAVSLEGRDILDGYRRTGVYSLGVGGVRWFRNPQLTEPFDEFLFWGPDDSQDVFCPRVGHHFALNHAEEIISKLRGKDRWFLFINCLETHAPYDIGGDGNDQTTTEILERAKLVWGGKDQQWEAAGLIDDDFAILHRAQRKALEAVDSRLQHLISRLDHPVLFVACGDHGEAFGENNRYGHGFPAKEVWEVPLVIGLIE